MGVFAHAWLAFRVLIFKKQIVTLKFDRHLGSTVAEMPVKFQCDWKCLKPNLAASRLREILG